MMAGENPPSPPSSSSSSVHSKDVTLRSEPSQHHSFVRFSNRTSRRADVIWFNYEGHGVKYKTLLPTQSVDVNTFVGHPWMFRDHDTGDRMVVHRQDIFKPEGYDVITSWPPVRRIVHITLPILSLFDACMKRVRDLSSHQPMPAILALQEFIPAHIVHDLIRQHKLAAIYFRMARGAYYGSSSTSIVDVPHSAAHQVNGNGYGGAEEPAAQAVEGNDSNGASHSAASHSAAASNAASLAAACAQSSSSQVNGEFSSSSSRNSSASAEEKRSVVKCARTECASTSSVEESAASSSSSSSSSSLSSLCSNGNSNGNSNGGSNGLSINARHARASRTLGLLSPCTVTTQSFTPRHSPTHSSHATGGMLGLLSVQHGDTGGAGGASTSAAEAVAGGGWYSEVLLGGAGSDSRDSLLDYGDRDCGEDVKDDDNESIVDDEDEECIMDNSMDSSDDEDGDDNKLTECDNNRTPEFSGLDVSRNDSGSRLEGSGNDSGISDPLNIVLGPDDHNCGRQYTDNNNDTKCRESTATPTNTTSAEPTENASLE